MKAFKGIFNVLFYLNSCANPFIYATTIPEFKTLVQRLFSFPCYRKHEDEEFKEKHESGDEMKFKTTIQFT